MLRRIMVGILVVVATFALVACSSPASESPPQGSDQPPAEDPSAGLRLAPGLYELEDGTAQALGTLEYRDIEGGFWAIIDGTKADGEEGSVAAVIANGDDFAEQLESLEGKTVMVTGKKLDGVSIRMAGPEIEIERVEEISDTPGIAE